MDVVTTSLEALIQRATNPQNKQSDIPAIEAFCVLVTKENEGVQIGCKLLATCIQSQNESEALQALTLLDTCMGRCGPLFHAEVGKFRFLNEMIKLVSPKYLGNKTPNSVRQKVLQLLCSWTKDYPRESKIKEAYEMLKKQGVIIEEDLLPIIDKVDDGPSKMKNTIFEDEKKSKLLQKLLRSKNPDDLQAANRLIKTMVKEDERRLQQDSRRTMELESVHNNVKLLSEMLDSYDPNETKAEDLELMKELHQACERLKPGILRLANEVHNNEEMLGDVLAASDELSQVFDKYKAVIILGLTKNSPIACSNNSSPLLDLSSPSEHSALKSDIDINISKTCNLMSNDSQSDMEVLGDIFNSMEKPTTMTALDNNVLISNSTILQPIDVSSPSVKNNSETKLFQKSSETKALEELNALESLLKEGLSWTTQRSHETSTLSVNNLTKNQTVSKNDSTILLNNLESNSLPVNSLNKLCLDKKIVSNKTDSTSVTLLNGNNCLVGVSTSNEKVHDKTTENIQTKSIAPSTVVNESKIKPLTDINISLQDIKPGPNSPITVIEEKNGISVILHFPKDSPREDVSVIVVTTMSKNEKPLHNYLFQAVISKNCKCRLQPPSGTELPAHNPFLPPSAITQIMLIANPNKEPVSLKFMLSYTMNEETYTEMGEVDRLPHL